MAVLRAIEYLFMLLLFYIGVTQLVIPLITNKPPFPFFRKKIKVEEEVIAAVDDLDAVKIEQKAAEIHRKIHEREEKITSLSQGASAKPTEGEKDA